MSDQAPLPPGLLTAQPSTLQQQVQGWPGLLGGAISNVLGLTDAARAWGGQMTPDEARNFALTSMLGLVPGIGSEVWGAEAGATEVARAIASYRNVPDTLMGFVKNGLSKPMGEQAYPHTQWVHVDLENGNKFVDAVKGLNRAHAPARAARNWSTDQILPLTEEQARFLDPSVAASNQ